jgi:hypothetical protein
MQTLYTDNFFRSNSINIGPNWSGFLGAPTGNFFNIAGDNAVANLYGTIAAGNGVDTYMFWSANTTPISANQFASVQIGQITANGLDQAGVGCLVRGNTTNTAVSCFITSNTVTTPNAYLVAYVNGVSRRMANTPKSCNVNDTILLTAIGTTYTMYLNGVQLLQGVDANIANGSPGIRYSSIDANTPVLDGLKNWSGGITASRTSFIDFVE